jgi:NAD(P)-dependent dehydrogenase (short-subunit alcohol dehydrogenase family)
MDLLKSTAFSRIVNVASGAHRQGKLDFDDLNWERRKYSAMQAYSDTKIANIYFTLELDRKLKAADIPVLSVAAHPGYTATDLQRHVKLFQIMNKFFAQNTHMGALPTVRAAVDSEAKGGDYYGPGGFMEMRGYPVKVEPIERAKDEDIAKRLWYVSENLSSVEFKV